MFYKYLDLNDFVVTGWPQTLMFYEKKPQVCRAGPGPGQSDMESNNNIVPPPCLQLSLQLSPSNSSNINGKINNWDILNL